MIRVKFYLSKLSMYRILSLKTEAIAAMDSILLASSEVLGLVGDVDRAKYVVYAELSINTNAPMSEPSAFPCLSISETGILYNLVRSCDDS